MKGGRGRTGTLLLEKARGGWVEPRERGHRRPPTLVTLHVYFLTSYYSLRSINKGGRSDTKFVTNTRR